MQERDRQAVVAGACDEVVDPRTKATCFRQRQVSEEARRRQAERSAANAERSRIAAEEADRRRALDAERDREAIARGDCEAIRHPSRRVDCRQRAQRSAEERRTFTGTWLSQEELRQAISGKTLRMTPQAGGQLVVLYFSPNGEAFYRSGEGGMAYRARGPWFIEGEQGVCTRGMSLPCMRFHRAENGALLGRYTTGQIYRLASLDGDPTNTEAEVKRYYPQAGAPPPGTSTGWQRGANRPATPAPDRSGVLGPSMSR
ncbi:hypothetical protein ACX4MT_13080 [Roseomonas mucosa]